MSAFMQPHSHIDYLLTSGMAGAPHQKSSPGLLVYDVRWPTAEESEEARLTQRGDWIGPGSMAWHDEHAKYLTRDTATEWGLILLAANRMSVDYRYDEEGMEPDDATYIFRQVEHTDPTIALQACAGYEYQACEHPEWHYSLANRMIDAIRGHNIRLLIDATPGARDGWSIDTVQYQRGISILDIGRK